MQTDQKNIGMASGRPKTIAVGVVTYNNSCSQISKLGGSLDVAIQYSKKDSNAFVLISIANGTGDDWSSLRVRHVSLPTEGNIGFARATNRILDAAKREGCDVLILANPDGAFHYGCLKHLLNAHGIWPNDILEARQFPEEHPKYCDPDSGLTNWSSGACMLIPLSCYEKVGGMDERFFLYMEDVDFSWRARSAGFDVRVVPKALFSHDVVGREEDPIVVRHLLESQLKFYEKWHGPRRYIKRLRVKLGAARTDYKSAEEISVIDKAIRNFTRPYFGRGRW